MEKLRFTKDDRELAKLTGKPSYFTTVYHRVISLITEMRGIGED